MILFLVKHRGEGPAIARADVVLVTARTRDHAANLASKNLGGNVSTYIVEPLTQPYAKVHYEITAQASG